MTTINNNEVRPSAVWKSILAVLRADVTLRTALGGAAPGWRIYFVTDDFSQPEGLETVPWYRVVLAPSVSVFTGDNDDDPRRPQKLEFLIRVEANNFRAQGFDVALALEGKHAMIYPLLYGWPSTFLALSHASVIRSLYRWQAPQQAPMYDEARSVWFTSAGWRTEVVAPPS